jgi:pimeloyl-ACP methyl ester carboxylesterase
MDTLLGAQNDVDLAGFSFGGITAAFLAAKRGRLRRLALLGPGAHGGKRRQAIELVDWRLAERSDMLAALRRNLVPFMLHDERNADALALAIHEWSCVQTRFRSKSIAQAGGLSEALDRITAPMLLLWGEHDVTAVPGEVGPRLAQGHANRHFRIVKDAGHWAQYEKADEVNARFLEWFSPTPV